MNFLFNEQSAIEKMIQMKVVENDNIFITVRDLARYNYFVCKMNNDDNYKSILKYLQNNGQNVNEENVYKIIDDCVKKAKKYQFQQVDKVCITQSEMDFIAQLGDIKKEKIAFVLLASAKYYDAVRGVQKHTAYMGNADICKLARVTIPANERNVFMQFAYDNGILSRHSRAASTEKKVLFVSQDNNDKIVLRLEESDFKDLAYTYLAYKTPHMFRRCVICRRWIKISSKSTQVCKECSSKKEDNHQIKMIHCIDCGQSVYLSIHNKRTCRCEDCQSKKIKEQKKAWWNKNNGNV